MEPIPPSRTTESRIRVTIAVPGTFHAFTLVEQLHKRGALDQVSTTYPRFALDTTLSQEKVTPIRYPEPVVQACQRFPALNDVLRWTGWHGPTEHVKSRLFDRAVERRLAYAGNDAVFLAFAGACLRSLCRANALEFRTVVERVS